MANSIDLVTTASQILSILKLFMTHSPHIRKKKGGNGQNGQQRKRIMSIHINPQVAALAPFLLSNQIL
jgi:hypothetical protein